VRRGNNGRCGGGFRGGGGGGSAATTTKQLGVYVQEPEKSESHMEGGHVECNVMVGPSAAWRPALL